MSETPATTTLIDTREVIDKAFEARGGLAGLNSSPDPARHALAQSSATYESLIALSRRVDLALRAIHALLIEHHQDGDLERYAALVDAIEGALE
jgi:hypothetical protein